jgi:hypothetical protein
VPSDSPLGRHLTVSDHQYSSRADRHRNNRLSSLSEIRCLLTSFFARSSQLGISDLQTYPKTRSCFSSGRLMRFAVPYSYGCPGRRFLRKES